MDFLGEEKKCVIMLVLLYMWSKLGEVRIKILVICVFKVLFGFESVIVFVNGFWSGSLSCFNFLFIFLCSDKVFIDKKKLV